MIEQHLYVAKGEIKGCFLFLELTLLYSKDSWRTLERKTFNDHDHEFISIN